MEKKMIDGVYTITGITSTSQVREFYKEVVAQNIEKYVAVTTQNIKFKFNPVSDCAVMLSEDEQFAINPSYRKIEVEPLDKLVEDAEKMDESETEIEKSEEDVEISADKEDTTADNSLAKTESVFESEPKEEIEESAASEETVIEESEPIEDVVVDENESHTDDPNFAPVVDTEQLEADNQKLTVLVNELEEKVKLAEERAIEAENQTQYAQKHCKDLEDELTTVNAKCEEQSLEIKQLRNMIPNEEDVRSLSVEKLFDDAAALGYKILLTK